MYVSEKVNDICLIDLLQFQTLFVAIIITLVKADIFETSQDNLDSPHIPLRPELIPRSLIVSQPPSGGYNGAAVRVPTPPDNVPDVISYLTK